jgi:hypothetical protein
MVVALGFILPNFLQQVIGNSAKYDIVEYFPNWFWVVLQVDPVVMV